MHSAWKEVMHEKMNALLSRGIWDFIPTVPNQVVIGCRQVFPVKYCPDGSIDMYKSHLVVKGYTRTYSIDDLEILMRMAFERILLFLEFVCTLRVSYKLGVFLEFVSCLYMESFYF